MIKSDGNIHICHYIVHILMQPTNAQKINTNDWCIKRMAQNREFEDLFHYLFAFLQRTT